MWVKYVSKGYKEMMDDIKTLLPITLPEIGSIVDTTNFWYRVIGYWASFTEVVNVFLDKQAQNTHILSCDDIRAMRTMAYANDYRIASRTAAVTKIKLTFVTTIAGTIPLTTIPAGTYFRSGNNILFRNTQQVDIYSATPVTLLEVVFDVIQEVQIGYYVLPAPTGLPNNIYLLPTDVKNGSVSIRVTNGGGTTNYTNISSFANAMYQDNVFIQDVNSNGDNIIVFGDGVNGVTLSVSDVVEISYLSTEGSLGNLEVGTITEFHIFTLTIPNFSYNLTNIMPATGGYDYETLEDMRKRIPLHLKSRQTLITADDYSNAAKLNIAVKDAFIDVANTCGGNLTIYVAGYSGNNPMLTPQLLPIQNYIQLRSIFTLTVYVLPVGVSLIYYTVNINVSPDYYNNIVASAVLDKLQEFFIANAKIKVRIYLSDLYQAIESVAGVSNSNILSNTVIPSPYTTTIGNTVQLVWTVIITPQAYSSTYTIYFISTTAYYLYEASSFLGTYTTGQLVVLTSVEFTVIANAYTANSQYIFHTYKSEVFNYLEIEDINIVELDTTNTLIIPTGGL